MKEFFKFLGLGIFGIIALLAIGWIATGNNFFMYKFFAPKTEQVRLEVFEQSKAYRQGMVQELQNMQFEFIKGGPEEQTAMRSIILHRAADVPPETMPADLAAFIYQLKNSNKETR